MNPMRWLMDAIDRIPDRALWWFAIVVGVGGSVLFGYLATTVPTP
jgi:hypothetical protein